MPSRDPTTGKFVSDGERRGAEYPDSYSDLEVQHVFHGVRLLPNTVADNDGLDDVLEWDPVEGRLGGGDVAELIGLLGHIHIWVANNSGGTETAQGYMSGWGAIGTDFQDRHLLPGRFGTAEFFDSREGEVDQAFRSVYDSLQPEVLEHFNAVISAQPFDTVTQAGAGHTASRHKFVDIWYPDHGLIGPVFDRRDNISTWANVSMEDLDSECGVDVSVRLLWNVLEREDQRRLFEPV